MKTIKKANVQTSAGMKSKSNITLYILLITFIVFANTFKNSYNLDDNLVTQNHPLTSKGLSTIKEIFSSTYYKDTLGYKFGYRPMVHLSFAIEDAFFGESPVISHFFNVVFYLIAVFLLYKLVLEWLGEEKKMIAILAALIFAVHPIHSEVVSSIKNRDEILAFLFAMLAALTINKYYASKKWWNALLVGVFFAFGMLSKKSIFPLVIVFPIANFLLQKPKIKDLTITSLLLLIPTSIIGGEGDVMKSCMLFFIPSFAIAGFIGVYTLIENKIIIDKITYKTKASIGILFSFLAWILLGLGLYYYNYTYIIISGLLFCLVYLRKINLGYVQMSVLAFILSFQNLDVEFLDFTLFFTFYFLMFDKDRIKKKYVIAIMIAAIVQYAYLAIHLNLNIFAYSVLVQKIIFLAIMFVLLKYKRVLGLIFSMLVLISFINSSWIMLASMVAVFFLILLFNTIKRSSQINLYLPIISFLSIIVISGFFGLKLLSMPKNELSVKLENVNQQVVQVETGIKEGRALEYVENTLVAPHSTEETIGTGFVTLGEYVRLLLFPKELSFYYGYSKVSTTSLSSIFVWISMLFYLGLGIVALLFIKKQPILSIGIIWFIGSILLFSNWVELVAGMVGERLAFTASAGFSIVLASIIIWIKPTFNYLKPKKVELITVTILVLFSVRTMSRNLEWNTPVSLMGADISHLENSAQANNMYAMGLMDESMRNPEITEETRNEFRNKAIFHLKKAIIIYPNFFNYNFDLGRCYISLNDNFNAKKAYLKAYKILPKSPLILEELTKTSFDLGQKEDTEFYGNKYLDMDPNNENINELVAYICLLHKDYAKTNFYAKRGLKYFPNNPNLNKMVVDSNKFL
ncbi:MAG: hypothetical protein RIQ59_1295 [Bacteroidota bacterium]